MEGVLYVVVSKLRMRGTERLRNGEEMFRLFRCHCGLFSLSITTLRKGTVDWTLCGLRSHDGRAVGRCINELRPRMLILVRLGIVPESCRRPHSADWAQSAGVNWFAVLWFACN